MPKQFSWKRLLSLIIKEFRQFKRDRTTFALVMGLPLVQLTLFGFAINTNPKHLPSALINFDSGPFSRTLVHGLENTQYFSFNKFPKSEEAAKELMQTHQVLFTLTIPTDFSRRIVRGESPSALLEVDGTDPVSIAYAVSATDNIMKDIFRYDLIGPLEYLNQQQPPAVLDLHRKYNPSAITQYNIVPGLLGTILTITFVLVASMALTRERERGTMESLLSTPIKPVEVIIGKSIPFLIVGYVQLIIVIFLARFLFAIPILGPLWLLLLTSLPFILANLFVGILISTVAHSQLEASQIGIFFFLPSMLLSGFAFPFKGMPFWAQWIGNVLPLTHFINIVRGIMLKGIGIRESWTDLWPLLLFLIVMFVIAIRQYRETLD